MKLKALFFLLMFMTSIVLLSAQSPTSADSTANREGQYLIHKTKLGSISYGLKSWFSGTRPTNIGIYLRKSVDLQNKLIDRDIAFSGYVTTSTGYYSHTDSKSGYIDPRDIELAIAGLTYIKDSLLTTKPDHNVYYVTNLSYSYFQIEASFNPYLENSDKEWSVYLDFDRRLSDEYVNIENKDVTDLIRVLTVAKQRLANY